MGYVDRFKRLEIPEERRRLDWSFLDPPLRLPAPLPLAEQTLLVLANGRAFAPDAAPPDDEGAPSVLFYRDAHALTELQTPGEQEAAWRTRHSEELAREGRRFMAAVPTHILRDPALVREACDILRMGLPDPERLPDGEKALPGALAARADDSLMTSVVGHARLLRLHAKLYDLVTLREYAAIFERAIAPDLFRALQAMPVTTPPAEMLAVIEARKNDIQAKARSPLRNKMSTARVVLSGATLLPIYREEATGLFEAWTRLFDRRMKLELLGHAA